MSRRSRLPLLTATAIVAVLVGLGVWWAVRPRYGSAFMDARWSAGAGAVGQVDGRVVGWNGRPEVGQVVLSENDSGVTVGRTTTDADGRFHLVGNGPPGRLTLVGIDAIPLHRWDRPFGPLVFDIRLKRPPPPPRGPL